MTTHQRRVLKRLLGEACRLRDKDKCLKCGTKERLQTSHIYPRGVYRSMEFDLDNVKTLCYRCHLHWWHKNPVEAKEWLDQTLTEKRLMALKAKSVQVKKVIYNKAYYEETKTRLENTIKYYKNGYDRYDGAAYRKAKRALLGDS